MTLVRAFGRKRNGATGAERSVPPRRPSLVQSAGRSVALACQDKR